MHMGTDPRRYKQGTLFAVHQTAALVLRMLSNPGVGKDKIESIIHHLSAAALVCSVIVCPTHFQYSTAPMSLALYTEHTSSPPDYKRKSSYPPTCSIGRSRRCSNIHNSGLVHSPHSSVEGSYRSRRNRTPPVLRHS
jgi:hypothetical protein